MTKTMRCFWAPAIAVLSMFTGSIAASASSEDDSASGSTGFPEDTHGKFVPAPDEYYQPQEFKACGTTVVVAPGDVRKTQYKATHADDGTVRIVYRGEATVDITRLDGAKVDELDVSGRTSERYSPDGLSVTLKAWGPNLAWATDEVEIKELAEEGLPAFLYFEGGKISGNFTFADETLSSIVSLDITRNSVKKARDVCQMLEKPTAQRR
jgi:hypothetical protein